MTAASPQATEDARWAFFAPASSATIEAAMDLAKVRPGERLIDLGCGDGRVLVAAGRRGACVRGVEVDPALADVARRNLVEAGVEGEVAVEDMFGASLAAEVIYAYLTPVTLTRLRPLLETAPLGARIVTPRYPIAGWGSDAIRENCHLYVLPVRPEAPPEQIGWRWRATLLVAPADRQCLLPLTLWAPRGRVTVEFDEPIARRARYAVGFESLDAAGTVPIDLIFRPHSAGSAVAGEIRSGGSEMTVAVVFANGGFGQWNFEANEGGQFRRLLEAKIAAARPGSGDGAT